MSERRYTIAEIDEMRRLIEQRISYTRASQAYYPQERKAEIEEQLRTYLIAGIDPVEFKETVGKEIAQHQQWMIERQRSRA